MDEFQTFIAILKGYCGSCALFTPKAFANGGFLFSTLSLCFSGILTSLCAIKLIKIGQKLGCYSYSEIVKNSFGSRG